MDVGMSLANLRELLQGGVCAGAWKRVYERFVCVCVCVCAEHCIVFVSERPVWSGWVAKGRTNARTSCCCVAPPRSRGPRRRPEVANGAIAAALSVTNGFAGCGRSIGATLRTMPGRVEEGRLEKIRQEKIGFEGLSQSRFLAPCPSSEPERKPGTPPNCHTAARCWRLQPGAAITSSKPWEYGAWRALRRCQSPRLSSA